jgi:hypothetical protein
VKGDQREAMPAFVLWDYGQGAKGVYLVGLLPEVPAKKVMPIKDAHHKRLLNIRFQISKCMYFIPNVVAQNISI